MADKKQKLLVIGMGSPNDMKKVEPVRLDGKPIDEYFAEKGIGVYHHPNPKDAEHPYLTTSIHRTTMESIMWAHDMQMLVQPKEGEGHKLVSVLFGGLALALPGVVASEAPSVPVIAVGDDEDAFWNTYRIPDGNTDAIVPVGNLEMGLMMAGKILDYDGTSVRIVTVGDCPNAEALMDVLDKAGVTNYSREEYDAGKEYEGLVVGLADTPSRLAALDSRVEFGILGVEKSVKPRSMADTMLDSGAVQNSVVVGRPKNLGYFAAKVVGLNDPAVAKKLFEMRAEEADKYPRHLRMELEHFGGGE